MAPRRLNDPQQRQVARRVRDSHWDFMRRLARQGVVHVCLWNKYRQDERANELRCGLIDGMELMTWVRAHRSWFGFGPHNRTRHTSPFWLTHAGRRALRQPCRRDDRAPVFGGLVEPGYQSIPLDFFRDLEEQRHYVRAQRGLSRPTSLRYVPRVEPEPCTCERCRKAARPKRRKRARI